MTVIRLQSGGLWIHSAVAPTRECMEMLNAIISQHRPVKYIVNPTFAVEHKALTVFSVPNLNHFPYCPCMFSTEALVNVNS